MSGSWDGGRKIAGAAALAVERVNADTALLAGRRLEYSWADSGCSAQQGLAAMGKLLQGERRIDAVICVRGYKLPVRRARHPADLLCMHVCILLGQDEIQAGAGFRCCILGLIV